VSSSSSISRYKLLKISALVVLCVVSFCVQANQRVYSLDKLKTIESFAQKIAAGKLTLAEINLNQESFASTAVVKQSRIGATGDDVIDAVLNQIASYFVAPFLTSKGVALLTSNGAVIDPGMKMTVNGVSAQFIKAGAKDYTFLINGKEYTIKYKQEES